MNSTGGIHAQILFYQARHNAHSFTERQRDIIMLNEIQLLRCEDYSAEYIFARKPSECT